MPNPINIGMKLQQLHEAQDIPVIQTPLPYKYTDLEPVLSESTVRYHYDVLTTNYFKRYHAGEGDREFNRAGGLLHNLYWTQLRRVRAANRPHGASAALIEQKYKSWENFQDLFIQAGMGIQGSGWVYWANSGEIKTIANHAWRSDIIFCIDCWEHSYMRNPNPDKKHHLTTIWRCVNWDVVNDRLFVSL